MAIEILGKVLRGGSETGIDNGNNEVVVKDRYDVYCWCRSLEKPCVGGVYSRSFGSEHASPSANSAFILMNCLSHGRKSLSICSRNIDK